MVDFIRSCNKCYSEKGQTIVLVEKDGKWVCPKNPNHVVKYDIQVA